MEDVRELTRAPAGVRRLWDVCQLPDFRKLSSDEHAKLVHTIFLFLMSDDGVLPDDWLARQIERARHHRRRCRHAFGPARADPHLDLCGASAGLDARRRPLAGRHARGGRPAVRRAARTADTTFHRPAHVGADETPARGRDHGFDSSTIPAASSSAARPSASWKVSASRPIRAPKAFTAAPCAPPR